MRSGSDVFRDNIGRTWPEGPRVLARLGGGGAGLAGERLAGAQRRNRAAWGWAVQRARPRAFRTSPFRGWLQEVKPPARHKGGAARPGAPGVTVGTRGPHITRSRTMRARDAHRGRQNPGRSGFRGSQVCSPCTEPGGESCVQSLQPQGTSAPLSRRLRALAVHLGR